MIVASAMLIVALANAMALTPVEALHGVLYTKHGASLVVERVNSAGHFATVLTRNGMMEGHVDRVPVLLEHFSFGWQALTLTDSQCVFDARGISGDDRAKLMVGMPKLGHEAACDMRDHDTGSRADVEALRRGRGLLVPSVHVVGRYALVNWYGGGGGQNIFRKEHGAWALLLGGGGAPGIGEMRRVGVPQAAWCALGIYNAKCPA